MHEDSIRLWGPLFLILYFFIAVSKEKNIDSSTVIKLLCLSCVAFSQNNVFYYRSFHQFITLCVLLYFFSTFPSKGQRNYTFPLGIILGFLLFILISSVFAKFDGDSIVHGVNFIACIGISLFVVDRHSLIARDQRNTSLIEFICNLSFLSATLGLVEFATVNQGRIEGTSVSPNYYGLSLALGLIICMEYLQGYKRALYTIAIIAAIALTGSRSALFCPVIYGFFHFLKSHQSWWRRTALVCASLLALVVFLWFANDATDARKTGGSDAERTIFAAIAVDMATDFPWHGIGWGRFPAEFANYASSYGIVQVDDQNLDVSVQDRRVTHNDLLRILAELGVVAAVMAAMHIILGFKIIFSNIHHIPNSVISSWVLIVSFSFAHNNINSALFWSIYLIPFVYRFKPKSFPLTTTTGSIQLVWPQPQR